MILQSTSFQFGGAILTTDDPHLERKLQRIIDLTILFLIQVNSLLMELRVLVGLQTTVYQRVIDIMDIIAAWIFGLVNWLNDVAIWYSERDRQLVRWVSRLVYVPVWRGIG